MIPVDPVAVRRIVADLEPMLRSGERFGVAVSGGPDSLALLILCAAAFADRVEAATVDHRLRAESADEAAMVARLCSRLGIAHEVFAIRWEEVPSSAVQEQARERRYAALGSWLDRRKIGALATGHHCDDQAETLLMRLSRGSGVRGLAAMRPVSPLPGDPSKRLLRPLLGWRRHELQAVCAFAGLAPVDDPSNRDPAGERARVRARLAASDWIDPAALARSAANLAEADRAVEWAVEREWNDVRRAGAGLVFDPSGLPGEIRRRLVERAIASLAGEGGGRSAGGAELDRLIATLEDGGTATLRGVRCRAGPEGWSFAPAPPRR